MTKKAGPLPVWVWLLIVLALIGGGIAIAVSGGGDDEGTVATETSADETTPDDTDESDDTDPPETAEPADTSPVETTPAESTPPLTLPIVTTTTDETTTTAVSGLPYELVITEQWFYPSGDNIYDYGGIVENHGTQTATGFIEVEIDFFDATDRILSTESAFVDTLVPGLRTPFSSVLIEPAAVPTRMEVRLADDNFIAEEPGPVGDITFANITTVDEDFQFDVNGDATSSFTVDLEFVQLVALWRDAGGAVIFSATAYLERVPAGSTTAFTISSFSELVPRVAPSEILFMA